MKLGRAHRWSARGAWALAALTAVMFAYWISGAFASTGLVLQSGGWGLVLNNQAGMLGARVSRRSAPWPGPGVRASALRFLRPVPLNMGLSRQRHFCGVDADWGYAGGRSVMVLFAKVSVAGYWFVLVLGVPTFLLFRAERREKGRVKRGLCPSCAYSLAGLAAGAKCPECGQK